MENYSHLHFGCPRQCYVKPSVVVHFALKNERKKKCKNCFSREIDFFTFHRFHDIFIECTQSFIKL